MVVRAARHDAEALRCECGGEHGCIGQDLSRVLGELGVAASRNSTALAAITWSSGPPCKPGMTALSMTSAYSGARQGGAAPRPTERLVGREGDDVGERHRVRMHAAHDETGDVRGVEHEQRADLVADRAERLGVDDA